MEIQQWQGKTKDGLDYQLRAPRLQDAQQMLDFLKLTAQETNFLLREPEEVETDLQQEQQFLKDSIESANGGMILAEIEGKLVGTGSISPVGGQKRVKHRCSLGIALRKSHWGLGLGSAIMAQLMKLAEELGYEQVELEVNSRNSRAIALYEKFGFSSYGKQYRAMKQKDGQYDDLVLMVKIL